MKIWPYACGALGIAAYGHFVESNRLIGETRTLRLRGWPVDLSGFTIGLLADLHIRDIQTVALTKAAISWLLDQQPDIILIAGDLAENRRPDHVPLLQFALEDLKEATVPRFAVSGNHDHEFGLEPQHLEPVLSQSQTRLLTNESATYRGIQFVGIASANGSAANPNQAFEGTDSDQPTVVIWHEPDMVDHLPQSADLMVAGHSHGGQFGFPNGWTFCKTKNGRKYYRGWYPKAPTPLYVSRGLATTFLPMRLFCPPEVTLLTILPA